MSIRRGDKIIAGTGGGGGTNVLVDDKTIIKNNEDIITAVGVRSKTGETLYDWIGTLEEYEEATSNGTIEENWVCYITDEVVTGPSITEETLNSLATSDLSNLTSTGEKHFLNKSQITNCILEAPNGVATYSGSTITVKSGIKVLIPFGKNEDGTLNNIEYTTDERVYTEQTSRSNNAVITIAIDNNGRINAYTNYFSQEENPNTPYTCWYKPSENNFYTSDGESNFSLARIVPILFYKSSNLQITNVIPYNTVDLLKRSNKSEISGWGMPSNRYIDLTLGASGSTYTAPANGWFYCDFSLRQTNASGIIWAKMITNKVGDLKFFTNGTEDEYMATLPVKKGDTISIQYQASSIYVASWETGLRFVYAEGSK